MRASTPIAVHALLVTAALPLATSGLGAQGLTAHEQIAAAVAPLPEAMRPGAKVLGYDAAGTLVTLREGSNEMICLSPDPARENFHVACYHESLEPFMARGRELRAQSLDRDQLEATRLAEAEARTLAMPDRPAALYSLTGPAGSFDAATGTVSGASPLYVVYVPWATEASTGLSPAPRAGAPWLMDPGKPWAHIMMSPPRPEGGPR